MIRHLALICAMTLLAAPSQAQAPQRQPAKAHLGEWAFKTDAYGGRCVLTGRMRITEAPNGALSCRFDAAETCPERVATAKQTCTVERTGNSVRITSKVVQTNAQSYVPDNFEVELTSPDLMRGMMRSFHSAPVVFRRSVLAIS